MNDPWDDLSNYPPAQITYGEVYDSAISIERAVAPFWQKAEHICSKAAQLVGGDRAKTHGDKIENHQNIAALWNAYLGWGIETPLTAQNVAMMMALVKVARTKLGSHNPDDYVDLAGYAGVAGEIAEFNASLPKPEDKIGGTD